MKKILIVMATCFAVSVAVAGTGTTKDYDMSEMKDDTMCTDQKGMMHHQGDPGFKECMTWKAKRDKQMGGMMPKEDSSEKKAHTEKREDFSDPTSGGY